ncbi:MAG: endolytic transglycosylase MltG [Candidatus Pacebacteria bacterium]|nr:endolytic transglycosylase MltG [Candidatus Paceibacterota bacterium]
MEFQPTSISEIPPLLPHVSVLRKIALALLVLCGAVIVLLFAPPSNFPADEIISIPLGATSRDVGNLLAEKRIVRSVGAFMLSVEVMDGSSGIQAGDYAFSRPVFVTEIARRMIRGMYGTAQVKLTFPEGVSALEMAAIIQKQLPDFDVKNFIAQAVPLEGYLFPNTYFVSRLITPRELIDRMNHEFERQYALLDSSGKSQSKSDVIIMASLLEKEANNSEEAKVISGILWKRISNRMPLQVDATFLYRLGKTSSELTRSDLRLPDPYNTYVHQGLPPGPIGNPGVGMISAALHPESSPYWYYLHDGGGVVYYARTYADHLKNRNLYIK